MLSVDYLFLYCIVRNPRRLLCLAVFGDLFYSFIRLANLPSIVSVKGRLYNLFYLSRGPDGELGASLRYLSQRYSMPIPELKGLLTDIGVEELGHLEMIGTIVHQLTRNLTEKQIEESGFAPYFVDHTTGVYPTAASGFPWSAASIQCTGDPIADLNENLAAEQKARVTYDNILRLVDDPDVIEPIKFLREREIVHFQRFGEGLRLLTDKLNSKNYYAFNPSFDKGRMGKNK